MRSQYKKFDFIDKAKKAKSITIIGFEIFKVLIKVHSEMRKKLNIVYF